MTDPLLTLTGQSTPEDERVVESGLANFDPAVTGYHDWRPLVALVRDPITDEPLGGMIDRTSYGLLFINLVDLPETLRGQDIGSRLMRMMEDEGIRRDCISAMLLTITWQAPGFHERNGSREFARVAGDLPASARLFMTKTLANTTTANPDNS